MFEIKDVSQSWSKPLEPKKVEVKEVQVEQYDTFEQTEKGEPLFRFVQTGGGKVPMEYNRAYTLKGYEQPISRTIWIEPRQTIEFSSLWNSNGFTKRVTLKRIE
ncbi:MAG: hypothetical protein V1847_00115 [Candidatus Diapherotrites archaeon]